MKREHIVPLAPQAVTILRELRALAGSDASPFLFPSPSREGHMSNNTMLYALYRMGYHGRATVHGFRAMASTALNEMGFRSDVIERQLAHQEQNAVRAAYNRAEYLTERRAMMKHWADHLDVVATGDIVPLKRGPVTVDGGVTRGAGGQAHCLAALHGWQRDDPAPSRVNRTRFATASEHGYTRSRSGRFKVSKSKC